MVHFKAIITIIVVKVWFREMLYDSYRADHNLHNDRSCSAWRNFVHLFLKAGIF